MLNNSRIHIIDRLSIQKNSLDSFFKAFRAQAKFLAEQCLDVGAYPGLHPETLLKELKKPRYEVIL